MNPERWARVEELFGQARSLPEARWPAFLEEAARGDRELIDAVLKMLRADAKPGSSAIFEPPSRSTDVPPPPDSDAWIGRTVGEFELRELIGRGGMGLVFRAWQPSLKRDVAVKVLPFQPLAPASQVERFAKEARAAAGLHHPNIVAIHAVGRQDELHWFAMELVAGPDLAKEIRRLRGEEAAVDGRLPPFDSRDYMTTVVRLVEQAADALVVAHEHGVIHRDVKPHNLLVDAKGDVRVVDFGLARIDEPGNLTKSGDQFGTPHYMSPEQVQRRRHVVDARTDVYSLGVVLYELLSLRRPFEGTTSAEVWFSIVHRDPPRLRKIAPRVPHDLETICHTAIARELRDRYANAATFRDDLRRFLGHQAIAARPPSLARRAERFARRHRVALAAGGAVVVAVAGGALFTESRARERALAADARLFEVVLALPDFDAALDQASRAHRRLLDLRAAHDETASAVAATAAPLARRFDEDMSRRLESGRTLLARGMADRSDPDRFGTYLSAPSERDLSEAMRILGTARTLYPENAEIAELARVEQTFPRVSIRLASDTLATAAHAADARAWLRPIDDVLCEVGEPRDLGPVPAVDLRVAPGYWRIVVAIEGYGFAEMTRYLVPSTAPYQLVARVLPLENANVGMKEIDGGTFVFKKESEYDYPHVRDEVVVEPFWIDRSELSNRAVVKYLDDAGAPPPQHWVDLGWKSGWRSLPLEPLGDAPDRWLELPAVGLTPREATACAEWYGKRLPTHAELERALRGRESNFRPWDGLPDRDAGGKCNIDRPNVRGYGSWRESFANYLRNALPTSEPGYEQAPEGLFHAYGNVAEVTESMLIEPIDGRLITFPWTRINLGCPWDAALLPNSLAAHGYEGVSSRDARDYIGVRCARSATFPERVQKTK